MGNIKRKCLLIEILVSANMGGAPLVYSTAGESRHLRFNMIGNDHRQGSSPAQPPKPRGKPTQYDFIVIGAGIAGASISYELAKMARVCLLEGESRPGVHATGRSAALFASSYGGREIRAITRASRAFFDAPPQGFTTVPLLRPRGCLYIAREDQREQLHCMATDIRSSGGDMALLDAAGALDRIPLLRPDHVREAAFDSTAMDIDVDALHQGFLRGARAAGAELRIGAWVQSATWEASAWTVELADGDVVAPVVINPLRRTALLVAAPAEVDIRGWPAVIDCDEQFYFKPEAGVLLMSPADETPSPPCDAHPEELDIAIAIDRVTAALDWEVRRVTHSWAGLRTFAADRTPIVGFDPNVQGLFWCAGQGGYGIQTAPAMGRISAAMALGRSLPRDVLCEGLQIENLSPTRFRTQRGVNHIA
jgi:D-arginine dehydrogenase